MVLYQILPEAWQPPNGNHLEDSACSQTVTRYNCPAWSKLCTWSMTLSFQLVGSLLECELLSLTQPSLNWLHHSLICVMPITVLPKACRIFQMVSTWVPPNFWENLMQYCCTIWWKIKRVHIHSLSQRQTVSNWYRLLAGKKIVYELEGTPHLPTKGPLHLFSQGKFRLDTYWTDLIITDFFIKYWKY